MRLNNDFGNSVIKAIRRLFGLEIWRRILLTISRTFPSHNCNHIYKPSVSYYFFRSIDSRCGRMSESFNRRPRVIYRLFAGAAAVFLNNTDRRQLHDITRYSNRVSRYGFRERKQKKKNTETSIDIYTP